MTGDDTFQKLLARLRNLCSRREYCVSDIRAKALKALDGDVRGTEAVIESLLGDGYVDDRRYCAAYAREKSSISGWGELKIRHMLASRGISRDDIDAGLAEIDGDRASARLDRLIAAKRKALGDDPQWKIKLLRFALGRGYGYEEVAAAVSLQERKSRDADSQDADTAH